MSKPHKPEAARLGWKRTGTRYPFVNKWIRLRQDRVIMGGRGEVTFTYHEHAGAVVIVPVTRDGLVIMARQYRYTVDEWCLEVPAGGLHDVRGSSLREVAGKELREETGAGFEEMLEVGSFYASNGQSDETCHVFLALGAEESSDRRPESTELIEVVRVPVSEALGMARRGDLKDGISALALLLCEGPLRERGFGG